MPTHNLSAPYLNRSAAARDLKMALKLKLRRRRACYPYDGEDRDLDSALSRLQRLNGREVVELLDWMRLHVFAGAVRDNND